jgi:hypothetical protein
MTAAELRRLVFGTVAGKLWDTVKANSDEVPVSMSWN